MDMVAATALQLAWCKGKDEPDKNEYAEAAILVEKWNKQRIANGLVPW